MRTTSSDTVRVILRFPGVRPVGFAHPQEFPPVQEGWGEKDEKIALLQALFSNRQPEMVSRKGSSEVLLKKTSSLSIPKDSLSLDEWTNVVQKFNFDWTQIGQNLGVEPHEARARYLSVKNRAPVTESSTISDDELTKSELVDAFANKMGSSDDD